MLQMEQRYWSRSSVEDRANMTVSFHHRGRSFHGSLWDYSRFGVGVLLEGDEWPKKRKGPVDQVCIRAFGQTRHLGAARVAHTAQESGNTFVGLILYEEFIDLEMLLQGKAFHQQSDEIGGIRCVLTDSRMVSPAVKHLAADLAGGLSVFKQRLDGLDRKLMKESASMKKGVFRALETGIGREFWAFMDEHVAILEGMARNWEPDERERSGAYLRNALWPFLELAPFIIRTITKPRGYPGDSIMMEMVYEDGYRGGSTFARFLHRHPLRIPSAQAVRNRRQLICSELDASIEQRKWEEVRVLSVACGPAREVKDYLQGSPNAGRVSLFLLDQDADALGEARESVREGGRDPDGAGVCFIQESVRTLLRKNGAPKAGGKSSGGLDGAPFHFIYTMGLFDYLTIPVARALAERLHAMAAPDAVLLIGNYSSTSPDRAYMDHLMDWPLLYKSPEEMLSLAENLPASTKRSIGYEASGVQMFLKLQKDG